MEDFRPFLTRAGLIIAFCVQAFYQELLLPRHPGPDDFHFPAFLQFLSHLLNILVATAIIAAARIPWRCQPLPYVSLSVLQGLSFLCGAHAPSYMNYPTLQLMKAAKPTAVLVVQCITTSTRPHPRNVLIVTLISLGLAIFCYTDRCSAFSMIGLSLGSGILFFDALASPLVDRLKEWRGPFVVMLYTQAWNFVIISVMSFRQILTAFSWVRDHQEILPRIFMYEITGSIGQTALFFALTTSDGLSVAIATTLRKFLTVVLSAVYFQHNLRLVQWVGIGVVFLPLMGDVWWARRKAKQI
jgi:UDP-galactose transporter B1